MDALRHIFFDVERLERTVFVTPHSDLNWSNSMHRDEDAGSVVEAVEAEDVKNVVLDLHCTSYFNSVGISFFMQLWQRVKRRCGKIVFIGLSPFERDILLVTNLEQLWTSCRSREEALHALQR